MKTKLLFLVLLTLGVFASCKKDLLEDKNQNSSANTAPQALIFGGSNLPAEGLMELGAKLKNPYSVTNMQIAYDELKSLFPDSTAVLEIRATHKYVKFLPQNQEEYQLLEAIVDIELFVYLLDYEIKKPGVYYRDPSIPEDQPNPQYASVPVDFTLPNVNFEVLEELYIPEEVEDESLLSTVTALVDQSLKLTNNLIDNILQISFRRPSKWNPDGFIRVYDDVLGRLMPLEGAKVRATRWFTTKSDFTDANGYYRTGDFRRPVNYSIKWETSKYDIRSGTWGQAKYDGPKQKRRWNLDIQSWFGSSLGYATVHRAAHRYFFRNTGGLKRPGNITKLKFNYYHDKNGTGVNWGNWDPFGVFPDIKLYGKDNDGDWYNTNVLYSTTIHEIAHTSHIKLMTFVQYVQVSKIIYESWANAVEFYLTQLEYNELGEDDYDDPAIVPIDIDNMQDWVGGDPDYTPLFIDFIDGYNQGIERGTVADRCPDGGTFDGNCYIGTPPQGETSFIYADNFYYTPVNCCDCPLPGSWYDGANCFVENIPEDRIGFIWNNNWYLRPAGDNTRPYDEISGYTMGTLESQVLRYSYGLTSLRTKLKENKPAGMTDKHIDLYRDYYFD